jgi:Protein of unknown function (DUF1570)
MIMERSSTGTVHDLVRASAMCIATALLAVCGGCARPSSSPAGSPALVSEAAPEPLAEPWTFQGKTGTLVRTRSFRIFTTLQPGRVYDIFPTFMEAALEGYTGALLPLPRPTRPMDTFLMRQRDEWVALTQQVMGRDAGPYLKMQRGGLTSEGTALLFDVGRSRDTLMLAAHEGWHQYTQSTFKEALPMWMEEGLATYMEGFRQSRQDPTDFAFMPWANVERFYALRDASRKGRLVSLERVLDSTPQDLMAENASAALQYYAQVWALVHFLNEFEGGRYRPALKGMVQDAADGTLIARVRAARGPRAASSFVSRRRGPEPLLAYVDVDLDTLNGQYQEFMGRIVAAGNERVISQGQRPALE